MSTRNLQALLTPRSVAVIGASTRADGLGGMVLNNILEGGFPGPVYAVNPKRLDVAGATWAASVEQLPAAPELAIVATPAATLPAVIEALGRRGTRIAIVISAGVTAANGLRNKMILAARRYDMRILGPNCLGIVLPHAKLNAAFARNAATAGHVALISQSGAIVAEMLDTAADRKIGFSAVISAGDMADVDLGDLIDVIASDPHTRAILLYVEGLATAVKFMSAARAASHFKPIVAIKAGRSGAAAAASVTNTGAIAGSHDVYSAAFRRAGIIEVETVTELLDAAEILASHHPISGDRVAIVTNGGGDGILAVDALTANGLHIAKLSNGSIKALDASLPHWSHGNPVDIGGDAGTGEYLDAIQILRRDEGVDAIMVINCPTAVAKPGKIAEAVAGRFAGHPGPGRYRPLIGCWVGHDNADAARAAFGEGEFPIFSSPEDAARAVSYLLTARHAGELTPAAEDPCDGHCDRKAAARVVAKARENGRTMLDEIEAKSLLAAYGVPVVETRFAATPAAVRQACEGLKPPLVVKILSPGASHKSDIGGVALNLRDSRAAVAAARKMERKIAADHPELPIAGYSVQPMVAREHSYEVIAGISDDATFGPVIAFGAGGKAVELLHDRTLELPPLNRNLSERMIDGTQLAARLAGYRGEPSANREAMISVLRALSAIAVDLPDVVELDINPLVVDPSGAIALDARVRISRTPRLSRLALKPLPMEWSANLLTRDGSRIHIRPAQEADAPALTDFFHHVSEEDRHFRFLSATKDVTSAQIAAMVSVDPLRSITFLAFDKDQQLLSAGSLTSDCNGDNAEVAISVRQDCKGRGIGWRMLEYILRYASAHSIKVVESLESAENRAAIELQREMGFEIISGGEDRADVLARMALDPRRRRERA
jgi:acetyltransferase